MFPAECKQASVIARGYPGRVVQGLLEIRKSLGKPGPQLDRNLLQTSLAVDHRQAMEVDGLRWPRLRDIVGGSPAQGTSRHNLGEERGL